MKNKDEIISLFDKAHKEHESLTDDRMDRVSELDFDCTGEWHHRHSECEYKGVFSNSNIENIENVYNVELSKILNGGNDENN